MGVIRDGIIIINSDHINWTQLTGVAGDLQNIVEDLSPQLGGQLDAQSNKIVDLLDPTLNQDAATKKYVDDELFALSALVNIVDDTTPQLGGNLDVNGQSIVSVSAGDIAITPDTTGSIILDGVAWPQADGTNGQVITTDGAGNLSFTTIVRGGLNNIVEDVIPQLGAQLDINTFGLGDGTNLLLSFVEDASAVNYIEIENEATGSGPILRAIGADLDVDLILQPKGTGDVIVGLTGPSEIRGAINENLTVGGGDSDATAVGGNTTIISGDGSGAFASGAIFITPGTVGTGDGDLVLNGLIWPIVDGTA